jgi:hypothetical protein
MKAGSKPAFSRCPRHTESFQPFDCISTVLWNLRTNRPLYFTTHREASRHPPPWLNVTARYPLPLHVASRCWLKWPPGFPHPATRIHSLRWGAIPGQEPPCRRHHPSVASAWRFIPLPSLSTPGEVHPLPHFPVASWCWLDRSVTYSPHPPCASLLRRPLLLTGVTIGAWFWLFHRRRARQQFNT